MRSERDPMSPHSPLARRLRLMSPCPNDLTASRRKLGQLVEEKDTVVGQHSECP